LYTTLFKKIPPKQAFSLHFTYNLSKYPNVVVKTDRISPWTKKKRIFFKVSSTSPLVLSERDLNFRRIQALSSSLKKNP
jgi:hypothetical protein